MLSALSKNTCCPGAARPVDDSRRLIARILRDRTTANLAKNGAAGRQRQFTFQRSLAERILGKRLRDASALSPAEETWVVNTGGNRKTSGKVRLYVELGRREVGNAATGT